MNSLSDLPDSASLPESLRLLSLVWGLSSALTRTSLAMEEKLGVTGLQRFLLRFVGLAPGISCVRLAQVMSCEPADISADLERLVAQNLLSGGAPGYYLTGQGAGVNSVMNGTVEQAVSKALDDATPYERTSFRRMLERVIGHLRPTS